MLDIEQIYRWWNVFQQDGAKLCEVRMLAGNQTYSGYFKSIDNLVSELKRYEAIPNIQVYFVLNSINEACYTREQCERMVAKAKSTTSDSDIVHRDWIMLDFDPKRPAGVSSSNEELMRAKDVAMKVYNFLRESGFDSMVTALSGNGCHILIPVSMTVSHDSTDLVVRFLNAISMMFETEYVEVDKKVFNPSRICKLYGTEARKGSSNSTDRPWRMSMIKQYPETIKPNDTSYVTKIARMFPTEQRPSRENNYGTEKFDVEEFFAKHGIAYRKTTTGLGTRYILKECPFDSNHKDPDSMVFQHAGGALAFTCFHNSCTHYTWKDFRLHYEPNAYDRKDYNEYRAKRTYYEKYQDKTVLKDENVQDGKKWLDWNDIQDTNDDDLVAIKSGIYQLDKYIKGFVLGELSIVCGLNGSGKSTLLNTFALNAIQRNYPVAIFSGELKSSRLKQWIAQVAAGKQYVTKVPNIEKAYNVNSDVMPLIGNWINGKIKFYNHISYGNLSEQLTSDIETVIQNSGVKLVFIDNLMAINIDGEGSSENKGQKNFVIKLSKMAKQYDVHFMLVVHPRKENGLTFLRKESVKGAGDITDAADNLFLCHLVGRDFEKRAGEFLGKELVTQLSLYDNVIEISKNRDYGYTDKFVGLYFEQESRRYKNSMAEQIHYDWENGMPCVANPYAKSEEIQEQEYQTFYDQQQDPYDAQFSHDIEPPF